MNGVTWRSFRLMLRKFRRVMGDRDCHYGLRVLQVLQVLGEQHAHEVRVTPAHQVEEWLPWVHTVITNLKRSLLGTIHGVSATYLQE